MKQAGIYVNDIFCGILTEDEEGFHFSYDETYLTSEEAILSINDAIWGAWVRISEMIVLQFHTKIPAFQK